MAPNIITTQTMEKDQQNQGIESKESRDDEKEESSAANESARKPRSVTDAATDSSSMKSTKKSADKPSLMRISGSAMVVEINKYTGKKDKPTGSITTKESATLATEASSTSQTTCDDTEPRKPKATKECGTTLLAQAAMQTSSLAIPGASPTLPNVTPPTLPQENPTAPPSPPYAAAAAAATRRRRGIPHTYRDYSNEPDCQTAVRKRAGGVTKPFPEKLHELLTKETEAQDVVAWLPHGRAFIVRKPKVFTSNIMGKYFKQTKLTSFQRQLNLCK